MTGCNRAFCWIVPWLVVAVSSSVIGDAVAEPEKVDFGGPRQVQVLVQHNEGKFIVHVDMLPVTGFDESTNDRVSRTRAELFALEGFCQSRFGKARSLVNHEGKSLRGAAVFSGVVVEKAGLQNGRYTLRLVIPEAGIQKPEAAPSRPPRLEKPSPLFTRVSDHEATIEALLLSLVRGMEELVTKTSTNDNGRFITSVQAFGKAGEEKLEALRAVIDDDILLSDLLGERQALRGTLDDAKKKWADEVRSRVQLLKATK